MYYLRYAFKMGWSIDKVYAATKIDTWYLDQLKQLVDFEDVLIGYERLEDVPREVLFKAKQMGYSDPQLANLYLGEINTDTILKVRAHRQALGVTPVYKLVDTCAAEFEAETPYYYSTYERPVRYVDEGAGGGETGSEALQPRLVSDDEVRVTDKKKVIILGGGPNRIGQGIEFDYCCVQAAFAADELGYESVMVNSNPETVSTDYDTSDLLFFEPLTLEDVLNLCERLNGAPFAWSKPVVDLTPAPGWPSMVDMFFDKHSESQQSQAEGYGVNRPDKLLHQIALKAEGEGIGPVGIVQVSGNPGRKGEPAPENPACVYAADKQGIVWGFLLSGSPESSVIGVEKEGDVETWKYFPDEHVQELARTYASSSDGNLHGVIVQFGGQTPLNLAHGLEKAGVPIIGTAVDSIDLAEDRKRFSDLIQSLGIRQPDNGIALDVDEAIKIANQIGYPVLVRPSFVLGGRAMATV